MIDNEGPVRRERGLEAIALLGFGVRERGYYRPANDKMAYWLVPTAAASLGGTAESVIGRFVGQAGVYAFRNGTHGWASMKPGDQSCFYAASMGIVADATLASFPEWRPNSEISCDGVFPWAVQLSSPRLYLGRPVIINSELRSQLDAFRDRDVSRNWGWFVRRVCTVTEHDFRLLIGVEHRVS